MKVRDKWRFAILIVIAFAAVLMFREHALPVFPDHSHKCSRKESGCPGEAPANGREGSAHGEGGSIIWDSLSDHLL